MFDKNFCLTGKTISQMIDPFSSNKRMLYYWQRAPFGRRRSYWEKKASLHKPYTTSKRTPGYLMPFLFNGKDRCQITDPFSSNNRSLLVK